MAVNFGAIAANNSGTWPYYNGTTTAFTSVTTSTNEVAAALLLPGGKLTTHGILDIEAIFEANSSANTKIVRFYINTAATLTGTEVQLATYSFTTNGQYTPFYRTLYIQSNTTLIGFAPSTSGIGGLSAATAAPVSTTIPTLASDTYIIVTVNRANAGDTLIMRGARFFAMGV